MAYTFSDTISSYLSLNSPISQGPLTISAWFNRPSLTTNGVIVVLTDGTNTTTTNRFQLAAFQDATLGILEYGASASTAIATSNYSLNVWNHACGVFSSTNSRTVYLNGGSSFTNTGSQSASGISIGRIGTSYQGTGGAANINGSLADIGIWNAALNASEVLSLSRGMSCDKIRPQNLVFYAPLIRELDDFARNTTLTNNNSATVSTHPRIFL